MIEDTTLAASRVAQKRGFASAGIMTPRSDAGLLRAARCFLRRVGS
jgi:hypothetical protein